MNSHTTLEQRKEEEELMSEPCVVGDRTQNVQCCKVDVTMSATCS